VEVVYYCTTLHEGQYCSNHRGTSLLPTSCKIVSNIFLTRLSPYVDETIGDHQGEFKRNRSTTDEICCIRQILGEKWEYSEVVHQPFLHLKMMIQLRGKYYTILSRSMWVTVDGILIGE
jgi:hypothetical protein